MGAVKNHWHDEICASEPDEPDMLWLWTETAKRERIATAIGLLENLEAIEAGIQGIRAAILNQTKSVDARVLTYCRLLRPRIEAARRQADTLTSGD